MLCLFHYAAILRDLDSMRDLINKDADVDVAEVSAAPQTYMLIVQVTNLVKEPLLQMCALSASSLPLAQSVGAISRYS